MHSFATDEKRKVLNFHNEMRQKVARGHEQRGNPEPQPAATNMPQLTWDDELEEMAQQWANHCDLENHDSCLPKGVGQNMASRGTAGNVNSIDVKYLLKDWYNEVDLFNSNEVASFVFHEDPKKIIGHYTQMLWAKTTKIGCGAIKFKEGEFNTFFLVCNYRVAGNCPGEPVYQRR
ncbi:venom allergen 3 homolog [Nasonia vitripennis]|uniref:SCP domain-containing protein n=1 Tax=Nasonia vitripennis TaxID=7425 RepID=A0A7M7QPF4_NASVI|nr:venom allergen 3 homolog [Nasonia vitripennis]